MPPKPGEKIKWWHLAVAGICLSYFIQSVGEFVLFVGLGLGVWEGIKYLKNRKSGLKKP